MSAKRPGQNSGATQSRDKLFNPTINVEQVVLDSIHNLVNSAILVNTVGDARQANVVFTMQALNLDSFIFSLLTSDDSRDWDEYKEKRKKIISSWPENNPDAAAKKARELFEITVAVWAKQRLFKLRRYTYFAMGWKKEQQVNFDAMADEDEKEGEEDMPT